MVFIHSMNFPRSTPLTVKTANTTCPMSAPFSLVIATIRTQPPTCDSFRKMVINCFPDSYRRFCIYCGRKWYRNHNCINPPNLRPAADALGLSDPIPPGMAQHLVVWLAKGDTPPKEMAARDAVCIMCDKKMPLGSPVLDDTDKCNSIAKGCGGSGYRPPLQVMQRLPSFRCPAEKWAIKKAESTAVPATVEAAFQDEALDRTLATTEPLASDQKI